MEDENLDRAEIARVAKDIRAIALACEDSRVAILALAIASGTVVGADADLESAIPNFMAAFGEAISGASQAFHGKAVSMECVTIENGEEKPLRIAGETIN